MKNNFSLRNNTSRLQVNYNIKRDLAIDIPIWAEELRQFIYCKRIIFWRRIHGIQGTNSYLMNIGTEFHDKKLYEKYIRSSDLENVRNKTYYDNENNFGGKIDLLRIREFEIIPVEVKRFYHSRKIPEIGHIMQSVLGGLAAEKELNKSMNKIEIVYWKGIRSSIEITDELRQSIFETINEMKSMIISKIIPKPTSNKNKCLDCEYWKICYRI